MYFAYELKDNVKSCMYAKKALENLEFLMFANFITLVIFRRKRD